MTRIPAKYHFIFGLKPQTEPFHLAWYLCLRSCIEVNNPDRVFFYYHNEPYGPWWERIKPELEMVHVDEVDFIKDSDAYKNSDEGQYIQSMKLEYAHQADFIRLRALLDHGGVYADIDTLFVQPFPQEFFSKPCVMGREKELGEHETLCNALILAEPHSVFIERWLSRMYEVFDGTWSRHSCLEPAMLSREMPEMIEVVEQEYFYHYPYTTEGLISLLGKVEAPPDKVCSIHMWSHLWWGPERTDFIHFHNEMLTEEFIRKYDTTYNLIARKYLG
ncbi:MAG: glycosyltransferase [Gammaproteobacteria bacterium]|nr:glycosyltransferase [Gammaproteobacteria bacterium]MDX2488036.1 glycosyltransferase [Gammaproteobacteria bacterium]